MDMYITWELFNISGCKVGYQNSSHGKDRKSANISVAKVDLQVIGAKDMYMYHMGIAQYFGCKVDLKVIRYGKHGHMYIVWQIENRPLLWL